ncbi:MAG: hypothetical protein GF393_08755 [Armatimonadia bacterium]|nr:hypothetical protein [Armatimonadia bacterium]
MRRLTWTVLLIAAPLAAHSAGIGYECRSLAGVRAHIITVDLNRPEVKVSVAVTRGGFPHANEPFDTIVARVNPTAAINGTFFDKKTFKPIGDIIIDGRLVHKGLMGTALAITSDNRAIMRRVTWGHAEDWTDYETVLACGPTLVRNGVIDVDVQGERFRDPHVLGDGWRSACGLTAAGKLKLVSVPSAVSLEKIAEMMLAAGCVDAMNLDGGASTAMYYRGRTIVQAGRELTNVLVAWEDEAQAPTRDLSGLPELAHGAAPSWGEQPEPGVVTMDPAEAALPQTVAEMFEELVGLAADMKRQGLVEPAQMFLANLAQSAADDAAAQFALGQALAKHGFIAEAKGQFEELLRTAPDCEQAAQARAELKKLQ